jgi:hypothetical protein
MRTFRTVLFVLCLALVTSTATLATPAETPLRADGRSFSSWMLSALDSVLAFLATDEVADSAEGQASGGTDDAKEPPVEDDDPPPDEYGGALEPHG